MRSDNCVVTDGEGGRRRNNTTEKCRRAEKGRRCTALITGLKAGMGERRRVGVKESSKQTEVRQVWKHPMELGSITKEMGLFSTP